MKKVALKENVAVLFLFISLLMGGCSQQEPRDQVILQLKWFHQAQFAGFYVAQEQGYYEEENLDVIFLEGGPEVDVLEQVQSGNADLGIYSPEDILIARGQGQPLVALAVIYQLNPMVFVSLEEGEIHHPADLLGRTISLAPGGEIQFQAMMKKLDLELDRVEIKPFSYDYESFYTGEVDVIEAYATGGLIRIHQQGLDVNTIWPGDYGVQFYSDTLFTTAERITGQPDLLERFLRASLKGWQDTIEDQSAAVEITLRYAKEADPDLQAQMLNASIPLIHTGDYPLGWMDHDRWRGMHDTLLDQGLLDQPVDLTEVYTNRFLEAIYEVNP
ncbi:MAG: ABC transporter substrate-binding protein [Anaerolineales bacterium]|nr:ABC transporter substrate-binding protein [Anaerolineales bacterium]